jgi:hypothetical protein
VGHTTHKKVRTVTIYADMTAGKWPVALIRWM